MTPTESSLMLGVLTSMSDTLQASISETWGAVQGAAFLTDSSVVKAWSGTLDAAQLKLNELRPDGRLGRAVLDGTLTVDRWRAIHSAQWDSVTYVRREVGLSAMTAANLWANVVVPSAQQAVEGAEEVVSAAKVGVPVAAGFVVVVLVLVLLVKVT